MDLPLASLAAAAGADVPPWQQTATLRDHTAADRPVLEALAAGLCLLDGEGRITYANATFRRLSGRAADELAGRPITELLVDTHGGAPVTRHRGAGAAGHDGLLLRPGAPPLPAAYQRTPLRPEPGAGSVLLLLDQAGRVREREALHESRERLQHIIETSPDLIAVIALDGLILVANAAFTDVLGVDPYAVVGATAGELLHPEDLPALMTLFEEALADRTGLELTARARHAAGHWVPLELRARVLADAAGTPVAWLVLARDVTERLRAEQVTRQARDEAERASRAKNEFLSRMSHELRTPLNAILGFAQILEADLHRTEHAEPVRFILKAGHHLLDLINETLDIARIEAGRLELHLEPAPLRLLLEEALRLVQPLAAERQITFQVETPLNDPTTVLADPQRLNQVLLNLLSNAIKYNHPGGRIIIRRGGSSPEDGRVRLHVQDTGAGIAPEHLARLFTPFDRLGAEHGVTQGTGLGLALSLRLVEAMNGTITVESLPGAGSTFTVVLPAAQPSRAPLLAAAAPEPVPPAIAPPPSTHEAQVLYIEDNLSNYRLVERILAQRPGVRLLAAMQGRLGVELARQHRPDLVLLDANLPDIHGAEVLAQLQALPQTRDIPVVVVSADAIPAHVERLLAAGAREYITKPINVRRLLEVVDTQLARLPAVRG